MMIPLSQTVGKEEQEREWGTRSLTWCPGSRLPVLSQTLSYLSQSLPCDTKAPPPPPRTPRPRRLPKTKRATSGKEDVGMP